MQMKDSLFFQLTPLSTARSNPPVTLQGGEHTQHGASFLMMEEKISHQHFCGYAGHYWQCEGKALRPHTGDTELSLCMCPTHGVPMDEGDHSKCMVELLACPEHRRASAKADGRLSTEVRSASVGVRIQREVGEGRYVAGRRRRGTLLLKNF